MNFDIEIVNKIWKTVDYNDVKDIKRLYTHINAFNSIPKTREDQEIDTWLNIATIYKLGVMMGKKEERSKKKE